MMAEVIRQYYGWKGGLGAYAVAGLIGFSRLEGGDHNLTDVAAGATLGYIVGRTVARRALGGRPGRLEITPATSWRGGTGVGLSYSW